MFDPRLGSKRFFNEVINLFGPTRGSNTSRITNSLPLFYLLNHTLNFQNWRLICVLQTLATHKTNYYENFRSEKLKNMETQNLSSSWVNKGFFSPNWWPNASLETNYLSPYVLYFIRPKSLIISVCFVSQQLRREFNDYFVKWPGMSYYSTKKNLANYYASEFYTWKRKISFPFS